MTTAMMTRTPLLNSQRAHSHCSIPTCPCNALACLYLPLCSSGPLTCPCGPAPAPVALPFVYRLRAWTTMTMAMMMTHLLLLGRAGQQTPLRPRERCCWRARR